MPDKPIVRLSRREWLQTAATAALLPMVPGTRPAPRGAVILPRSSAAWMSQQVNEPCVLTNPKVPGRLVMLYSGVPRSDRVVAAIGKAWADASNPFEWHQAPENPVFGPSGTGWDARTIRLDCVLHVPEEDAYYIYYSGTAGSVQDHIGLAICPVGDDGYSSIGAGGIRRFGDGPILAPEPAAPFHEEMVSQSAVLREWDEAAQRWEWTMYYSYRGKDGILPGIRMATSTDGKSWTRQFRDDDPRGMGQIFRSTPDAYYEWHQVFKLGQTYVLCIEVGVERGRRWRAAIAVSDHPRRGWRQLDLDAMVQTTWDGLYDDATMYHVATPALHEIGGLWYLFCQACGRPANDNYIDGGWDVWCIACERPLPTGEGLATLTVPGEPG
jgi:hypothetical protein